MRPIPPLRACCLLLLALVASGPAHAQELLLSVGRDDRLLRTVDPDTGQTQGSVQLSLQNAPAAEICGGRGLAHDPTTGLLWAVVELFDQAGHELVRVDDPASGAATAMGNTGLRIADLAFGADGTLYGLTEDLGGSLESLETRLVAIDLATGDATSVLDLGTAAAFGDGDALASDPDTGLLHRTSGPGFYFPGRLFESVDPDSLARAAIALSGDIELVDEFTALTGSAARGAFLGADIQGYVYELTHAGLVTRLYRVSPGYVPADLATVPEPRAALLHGAVIGALALLARRRLLAAAPLPRRS